MALGKCGGVFLRLCIVMGIAIFFVEIALQLCQLQFGSPGRAAAVLLNASLQALICISILYWFGYRYWLQDLARQNLGGHPGAGETAPASELHVSGETLSKQLSQCEKKRISLERSSAHYRKLMDAAEVIILRWSRTGTITFLNRYGLEFFGYTEESIIGRNVLETIVPRAESFTGRNLQDFINDLVLHPQRYNRNENENLCRDGTRVWISWTNTALYDEAGNPDEILSIGTDLTLRRKMEDALANAEQLSRSILESAGEGIYGIDPDGNATFVNRAAAYMLGYSREDLVGKPMHDMIHHHYRAGEEYPLEKCPAYHALRRGVMTHVESEVFWRRDGTCFPVNYTSTPILAEGTCVGAVVTFRDVTDRERILRELEQSETRLRIILETMADAVITMDEGGIIQAFNSAAERVFGYTREEVLGKGVGVLIPEELLLPYRTETVVPPLKSSSARARSTQEVTARRRNGELILIDISLAQTSTGAENILIGVIRDITERKHSEESLRKLSRAVEASPVSVVITDAAGRIEYVNPKFEETTGYTREEAVGSNPRILKSGQLDKGFYGDMWGGLLRGEEWHGEFHNKKKDGSTFWERASISPIRDLQGEITHFVAVKEDVTEQMHVAEQLKQAKEAAEIANRAKSFFLANMSHEIRTPLNAIMGFGQLLWRTTLTTQQRNYLETMSRSSEHLLALINDILDMSRIETGKTPVNLDDFDLNRLLKDLHEMFVLTANMKDLNLVVAQVPAAQTFLRTDQGKLRQILINLIGNAVKFTGSGSVTVIPSLACLEGAPVELEILVQDSGPGISAGELDDLFDAFVQTSTGRGQQGGSGLGLAISRKFVQLLGGELSVESTVGEGSVFKVRIPVAASVCPPLDAREEGSRCRKLIMPSHTLRILVADDVAVNRELVTSQLSELGFEVHEATNGEEALQQFQACRPHLVLMDMGMPVMDGYEATRRLKATEEGRNTPVIAFTARVFTENQEAVMSCGADGFLGKPFHDYDLLDVVGRFLGICDLNPDPCVNNAREAAPPSRSGLDTLPEALRHAIEEAVTSGRHTRLPELIEQVGKESESLAESLQSLVDGFQYRQILQQLKPARSENATPV